MVIFQQYDIYKVMKRKVNPSTVHPKNFVLDQHSIERGILVGGIENLLNACRHSGDRSAWYTSTDILIHANLPLVLWETRPGGAHHKASTT